MADSKHPWPLNILEKEWPKVKECRFSLIVCVLAASIIIGFGIWGFANYVDSAAMRAKDATLAQKDATIATISEERNKANRENDKLRTDIASYQAARADKAFPLKRRALILSKQLSDFADNMDKNPNQDRSQQMNEWESRFQPRLRIILNELDVIGQHSDTLQIALGNAFMFPLPSSFFQDVLHRN